MTWKTLSEFFSQREKQKCFKHWHGRGFWIPCLLSPMIGGVKALQWIELKIDKKSKKNWKKGCRYKMMKTGSVFLNIYIYIYIYIYIKGTSQSEDERERDWEM